MKALTIWQPWASCIMSHGKTVENRGWYTHHRGKLLIHAAARMPEPVPLPDHVNLGCNLLDLPRGVILGTVEVLDCVRVEDWIGTHPGDPWACGPWCWVLSTPVLFQRPVPVRGAQGLWTYSGEVPAPQSVAISKSA